MSFCLPYYDILKAKGNGSSSAAEDIKDKPGKLSPVEYLFVAAVYVTIPVTILFAIVRGKMLSTVTEGAIK